MLANASFILAEELVELPVKHFLLVSFMLNKSSSTIVSCLNICSTAIACCFLHNGHNNAYHYLALEKTLDTHELDTKFACAYI